eukprot:TRINITY_DN1808_c0_g1_i1.p1 TRINITY_DN1808_c0_g1~~TRINITY_DN1808_c0_g1_i1.p1  ORF type:complete len:154 (-),score=18.00 TRINITY_DN1808_c0_g1_i1:420-881(-)
MEITYRQYNAHDQLEPIMKLMEDNLSEPYSVYTYRHFIFNWPQLCWMAFHEETCIGAVVCKLEFKKRYKGYIAMLAVSDQYRGHRIGSTLVKKAIKEMKAFGCIEAHLETEATNLGALKLYKNLGFMKDKRHYRYYLNGNDAYRLRLFLDHDL